MHIPSLMINNLIYTADPIKWTFSCDYPTTYDVSGINGQLVMASSGDSASFESTGSFEIDLSLFKTDTFENKDSDPLFKVGRAVNFGSKFVEPFFLVVSFCTSFSHFNLKMLLALLNYTHLIFLNMNFTALFW